MKRYNGNISKWKDFLRAWMTKRGDLFTENSDYNENEYSKTLSQNLPKSYVDFYFALKSFDKKDILKIEPDDDESSIEFNSIENVIEKSKVIKTPPAIFNDDSYKIYSDKQEELSPFIPLDDFMQLLLIGQHEDIVFQGKILLNQFLKFDDGEFEAVFLEIGGAYEVRFTSFAELVVWFYLRDPVSGVQLNSLYGDHINDTSKLSSFLFE
jgi:hypothetical protein